MSPELKSRDEYTGPFRNMERSLEHKRSSRQKQISDDAKEKVPSCQPHQNSKVESKSEVVYPFAQPYVNQTIRLKKQTDNEQEVQLKPSRSLQKQQFSSKMERRDELVRHMSDLPAYLQQAEKQKNVQEKALNFGVLDWKRLEKWKYNERMPARGQRKASSSDYSSSMANVMPSLPKTPHRKQSSAEMHRRSFREDRLPNCVQQFPGKIKHIQDSQTTFRSVSGQQIDISQKEKSSSRSYPEIDNAKSMRMKEDQKTAVTMQKEILSSTQIKQVKFPNSDQYRKKKTAEDNETYPSPKYSADEPRPIVLLVPKLPLSRSSVQNSQLPEPRTSLDVDLAQDSQKRSADCFPSQEFHSEELCDEILHSCPLPASVSIAPGMQSDVRTCPHQNDPPITARPFKVKRCEREKSIDDCSVSVESFKSMDLDTTEQPAVKGRHSSPIRRFSFSLGRLSRSFSFKESSTVPQLSSTYDAAKSGPVSSDVLAGVDDYYVDKAHAGERRRSSPFRRLLDPILKPKGAHSARIAQPSDKSWVSSSSEPTNTNKQEHDQTYQGSTLEAILQLTIKNRLPYFRFAVDNSSDILAAAVKKPQTCGKGDCSLTYTFYSVREIKKKSGSWISHGSKEKSCSIGYNIIAEMKSIYCLSNMLRESVLYTVDIRKGDKGQPEVLPKEEIAATVVKAPAANHKGEGPKLVKCKQEGMIQYSSGNFPDPGEEESFSSTVAILPGGTHSLPNGGKPSSLIDRWKSGGLCDCGGWDIGCKLRVLTDKNKVSNHSTSAMIYSAPERTDLFNQVTIMLHYRFQSSSFIPS